MSTGENEQGLHKILDMSRMISIIILGLHFYYYCYRAFEAWGLRSKITDKLVTNIANTGLFSSFTTTKLLALGFLVISLMGAKGKKEEKLGYRHAFVYIVSGSAIFFASYWLLLLKWDTKNVAIAYISSTSLGFVLVLTGGILLTRVIRMKFSNKDIFNKENETFPQEERLLENDYSINLPAVYPIEK